jgi:hypothetical protein
MRTIGEKIAGIHRGSSCLICGGSGKVIYGSDTESGREEVVCECRRKKERNNIYAEKKQGR